MTTNQPPEPEKRLKIEPYLPLLLTFLTIAGGIVGSFIGKNQEASQKRRDFVNDQKIKAATQIMESIGGFNNKCIDNIGEISQSLLEFRRIIDDSEINKLTNAEVQLYLSGTARKIWMRLDELNSKTLAAQNSQRVQWFSGDFFKSIFWLDQKEAIRAKTENIIDLMYKRNLVIGKRIDNTRELIYNIMLYEYDWESPDDEYAQPNAGFWLEAKKGLEVFDRENAKAFICSDFANLEKNMDELIKILYNETKSY
ncbi:hypothetical protein IHN63_08920 [Deinococcus sp. 6YEL10]|uniref:hypothetical protein n=1 Tax=Deinococcus sp. 6YEL10 TaxID=2745870 RepID=UPI001E2F4375|nr:hypothetical protein [Deinococcus sp. 6YEL10]MCD0161428.1 hypothetical protein [Deinococcus sp. 6YEL10]